MPTPTPQQIITAALARLGGAAALNHPYAANDDAGSSYYALQMAVTHPTAGLIATRYPFWVGARGRGVVAVGRTISRPPLGNLAAAIGEQLGARAHPSLLLLLAATATHRAVPSEQQCRELGDITSYFVSYTDRSKLDEPTLSSADIQAFVADALAAPSSRADGVSLPFPRGAWNSARALFAYGKAAWSLRSEAAAYWLCMPIRAARRSRSHIENRMLLHAAAMVTWNDQIAQTLPFEATHLRGALAFLRWSGVAAGPPDLPMPVRAVLEARVGLDERLDTLASWSPKQQEALRQYAKSLVNMMDWPILTPSAERVIRFHLRTERPSPRYVGQYLSLCVPRAAVPALEMLYGEANLERISVVPHPDGMWVMFHWRDPDRSVYPGDTTIWWEPSLGQADYVPPGFPFQLWSRFYLMLCLFWSDLHRQAEVVERVPGRVSPIEVNWGNPRVHEKIARSARLGNDYRRLPAGWERLIPTSDQPSPAQRAFQQRRAAADARAQSWGRLPPPNGYTYVKPHHRSAAADSDAPREVIPLGLHVLALELPVMGQDIAETADGDTDGEGGGPAQPDSAGSPS